MSEPVKKPGHVPESYQPKKPEIVSMTQEAQGQAEGNSTSHAASSAGGGGSRMIPDVPVIKYDGNNAGMYITMLVTALQSMGEKCDRAKLTALSGAGNRFCWMDGEWHGGCEMPDAINETPYETESRVLNAIGWKAKFITVRRNNDGISINSDPAQIRQDFVASINEGFPVIAFLVKQAECRLNLYFGYEDGGQKVICYDYVKGLQGGTFTNNETPALQEHWENNIEWYVLLQGKVEAASERETALSAFQWISGHARRTTEINGKLVGFAAWESYLRMLEHDNFKNIPYKAVRRRFGIYMDGLCQIAERHGALEYYRALAGKFPEWREELEAAVAALDACASYGGFLWKNGFPMKQNAYRKFKKAKARKMLAEAGREAMRKDMEAVGCFEAILRKEGLI